MNGRRRQAAVAEGSCVCWGHHMLEGEERGAALHLKSLTLNRARTLRVLPQACSLSLKGHMRNKQ
jgi:hypothetical protein